MGNENLDLKSNQANGPLSPLDVNSQIVNSQDSALKLPIDLSMVPLSPDIDNIEEKFENLDREINENNCIENSYSTSEQELLNSGQNQRFDVSDNMGEEDQNIVHESCEIKNENEEITSPQDIQREIAPREI